METLHRSRLSECLDGVGVRALLLMAGVLVFTGLWGLSVPSMIAGTALGILLMLGRTAWRRRTVSRREQALRRRLGGELFLEELLYAGAQEAHVRIARLLAARWPLAAGEATAEGVLCRQGQEMLLIQAVRMPSDGELSVGDLLNAQRVCRQRRADRAVLCVMGRVAPRTAARAEDMPLPVRILRRETLLLLAGRMFPATDEQLVALGKRRRRRGETGGVLRFILRRDKARRYFGYGLIMLLLYVLTDVRLYAVPGMVCLTMAVLSGCERHTSDAL